MLNNPSRTDRPANTPAGPYLKPVALTLEGLKAAGFRLYEKARRAALWNAATDIPWNQPLTLKSREQEMAWLRASQAVYAEQAGLLTAALMLQETNDVDGRFCLATAVADEAKHAEVFARYALKVGQAVAPMNETLDALWEFIRNIDDPNGRAIVHTALEGIASDQMTLMIKAYSHDLLGTIYQYVRRDEKRHVVMGMDYLARTLRHEPMAEELLEKYGHLAMEIGGMNEKFFETMAELGGETPTRVREWFVGAHNERTAEILARR
jgi:hypothetical protein